MAMGKKRGGQPDLWLAATDLPQSPGHPFYEKLNEILRDCGFDRFCGERCAEYYAEDGRPSIPPGTYFRLLLVGFFEGISSERGICWRCSDSLSLRSFLGLSPTDAVPNHSSLCRIRQRLPVEVYREVFDWVLERLGEEGLLKGKTLGVDATTLEANAAMRSIVRKDSGQAYNEYLEDLAKAEGIESPTRSDLKKLDRKRKKKGSNDDWENPHDPDARITRMKDGRTHLAYKAEHAVDLDSGAIVAAEIHPADEGDTKTASVTIGNAMDAVLQVCEEVPSVTEVVADKGYHSSAHVALLQHYDIRTYISEPERGCRRWKSRPDQEQARTEQSAVYANRRRQSGERAGRLHRKRAELAERSFAHVLETGGHRRSWLRGLINVGKRYLIQVAAFNLGLIMRNRWGVGTPRAWASSSLAELLKSLLKLITRMAFHHVATCRARPGRDSQPQAASGCFAVPVGFSTGC